MTGYNIEAGNSKADGAGYNSEAGSSKADGAGYNIEAGRLRIYPPDVRRGLQAALRHQGRKYTDLYRKSKNGGNTFIPALLFLGCADLFCGRSKSGAILARPRQERSNPCFSKNQ